MGEEYKPAAEVGGAAGASPRPTEAPQGAPGQPFLPASFFSKLVHQPSCITKGVCDNCGRCEH